MYNMTPGDIWAVNRKSSKIFQVKETGQGLSDNRENTNESTSLPSKQQENGESDK